MFNFSKEYLVGLLLQAVVVLLTLTLHEFAHGLVAYKLGDNTAKLSGRLTLNPLKHIDPYGAICMLFFRIGWARPVPINPRNFKNPKSGFALTALAGPLTNLVLGFSAAPFLLLIGNVHFTEKTFLYYLLVTLYQFLYLFHYTNIGFAVFNLLPIPPFDGSRILNVVLPPRAYFKIMHYERVIYWFVFGWLLLGGFAYDLVLQIPAVANNVILSNVARILSLSDIISYATDFLSSSIMKLWQLIPALR